MTLGAQVARNTIVHFGGKIISTILGMVAIALMTRYLGQTGFGQYTTIVTFLSFFAIIADLGLTLVTSQMISYPGADEKKILNNLFSLRLVTAIFFLGLAPLVIFLFPYGSAIKIGVLVATLSFFFAALNQIFIGLFQKKLRLDKVALAEVVGRLALIALVYAAMVSRQGLNGIIIATVAASAINFFLLYWFSRSAAAVSFGFDLRLWREIVAKSWPLALTIVFNLIYLKTDTILLTLIDRPTAIGYLAEVGLYGAAYRVIDVLVTLPFIFSGIMLPILTAYWTKKDQAGFTKALDNSFRLLALLALPLVIGTQFAAKPVMVLVAGEDFAAAGDILKILILAAGFIYLGNVYSHAVIAIDCQKKIISAYAFTAVTSVIGYFVFIPRFSYWGAAWVTVYSELTIALATAYLVFKYARVRPRLDRLWRPLLASGFMALIFYATDGLNFFFVSLPLAAIVYFTSLYLLKGFTKDDVKMVIAR